jgi:DNA-binding NarL/FixJ family response regulator
VVDRLEIDCQEKIRVVITEDHPVVRSQIRKLLDRAQDICVIGEASNGYEAIEMVEELKPDVLLLDIEMPGMNGILVARTLQAISANVKVLVLSGYADKVFVEAMLKHGVQGYVTKDDAGPLVVEAVRRVARDERGWFSGSIQNYVNRSNK